MYIIIITIMIILLLLVLFISVEIMYRHTICIYIYTVYTVYIYIYTMGYTPVILISPLPGAPKLRPGASASGGCLQPSLPKGAQGRSGARTLRRPVPWRPWRDERMDHGIPK